MSRENQARRAKGGTLDAMPLDPCAGRNTRRGALSRAFQAGGKTVFVTIRKYTGCRDQGEVARVTTAELLPVLRKVPGFRSFVGVDIGEGSIISIGVFDSKEAAELANERARAVVGKSLAPLLPNAPEVMVGEIFADSR